MTLTLSFKISEDHHIMTSALWFKGSYTCTCAPGFYGVHCRDQSNTCSSGTSSEMCGHGTCVDTPSSSGSTPYTCICDEGWTTSGAGPMCNQDINECAGSKMQLCQSILEFRIPFLEERTPNYFFAY